MYYVRRILMRGWSTSMAATCNQIFIYLKWKHAGYACYLKPEYRFTFHLNASKLIITVYSCRLLLATRELSRSEAVNGCTVWTVVSYVNLQGDYCCSAKPCHCYSCYCWMGNTLTLLGACVCVCICACLFLPYACMHASVSSVICVLSIVRVSKCVYFGKRLDTMPTTTEPRFGAKTHSAP